MNRKARIASLLNLCLLWCCSLYAQDSLNISQLSTLFDFWDAAVDVEISGNYAYVSTLETDLYILDISDSADPEAICHYRTPGYVFDVKVAGNYAYLADGHEGLLILDISDPANPIEVGHRVVCDYATNIDINENYAYIAAGFDGLRIYDVSDVTDPVQVSRFDAGENVQAVYVAGNLAYVASSAAGLRILDISDPAEPSEIGFYEDSHGEILSVYEIVVRDNLAFLSCLTDGLILLDVSTPSAPSFVANYSSVIDCMDAAVLGDTVYIADHIAGMKAIDVSTPSSPQLIGSFHTLGQVFAITVSSDIAYVADRYAGLRIVSLNETNYLQELSCFNEGLACDVEIQNDYAYVSNGFNGLHIIDISDPSNPSITGIYDTDRSQTWGLEVAGDYAYLADWDDGLRIIDISNPANPTLLTEFDTPGYLGSLAINGNFAYLLLKYIGLQIVDISNPLSPVSRSFLQLEDEESYDIDIVDSLAYITNYYGGLRIIDISNSNQPQEIGFYTPLIAYGVCVVDSLCYLTSGRGFKVLDVSDPTSPELITWYNELEGIAYDINVAGNFAFLADGDDGIYVVDVSNYDSICVTGYYNTNGNGAKIEVTGGYSYLAEGYHFSIFDHSAALSAPESILSGIVSDSCTGQPIAGAEIILSNYHEYTTETDESGIYRFNSLFPLTYAVSIGAEGMVACEESVTVSAGTNEHDFELIPTPDFEVIADESYQFTVPYLGSAADSFVIRNAADCSADLEFEVMICEDDIEGRPLNEDWLAVSVDNGTVEASEQFQIQILIDASLDSLDGGTWSGYILIETNDPDSRWYGMWVFITVEPQSTIESLLPLNFNVAPPFPNPFNSTVAIPFSLPSAATIDITIYNIIGQSVYHLNQLYPAGYHWMLFDTQGDGLSLSSGTYFLQFRYRDQVQRCRLMLIK